MGGQVGRCRKGHDLLQVPCTKPPVQGRPGTLAGEALAPEVRVQTPADLHAGADRQVARSHPGQSDHPRQPPVRASFRGPEAKALRIDAGADPVDQGVTRLGRDGPAQPVMDPGVAIDLREGGTVGVPPGAQDQAVGDDHAGRGAVRAP